MSDPEAERAREQERARRPERASLYENYVEMDAYQMMSDLHTGYADDCTDERAKAVMDKLASEDSA